MVEERERRTKVEGRNKKMWKKCDMWSSETDLLDIEDAVCMVANDAFSTRASGAPHGEPGGAEGH